MVKASEDAPIGEILKKVVVLCHKYPQAANDDTLLMLAYWMEYDDLGTVIGKDKLPAFEEWLKTSITPAETIIRVRRRLEYNG